MAITAISVFLSYSPVFGNPMATIEVVGKTGTTSPEKAALYRMFKQTQKRTGKSEGGPAYKKIWGR
jgi:hypothetical protein